MKPILLLISLLFAGCGYSLRFVDADEEWRMKLIRKNIEIISLYMVIDSLQLELYNCQERGALSKRQYDFKELMDSAAVQTDKELENHPMMRLLKRYERAR